MNVYIGCHSKQFTCVDDIIIKVVKQVTIVISAEINFTKVF